mmetsp:Transcript_21124/g.52903  ORF Transcript_21124/g.52903 Transcript_21124/m.52903 type:complete len:261 (+) Transcript_21124:723-1505(+)
MRLSSPAQELMSSSSLLVRSSVRQRSPLRSPCTCSSSGSLSSTSSTTSSSSSSSCLIQSSPSTSAFSCSGAFGASSLASSTSSASRAASAASAVLATAFAAEASTTKALLARVTVRSRRFTLERGTISCASRFFLCFLFNSQRNKTSRLRASNFDMAWLTMVPNSDTSSDWSRFASCGSSPGTASWQSSNCKSDKPAEDCALPGGCPGSSGFSCLSPCTSTDEPFCVRLRARFDVPFLGLKTSMPLFFSASSQDASVVEA